MIPVMGELAEESTEVPIHTLNSVKSSGLYCNPMFSWRLDLASGWGPPGGGIRGRALAEWLFILEVAVDGLI